MLHMNSKWVCLHASYHTLLATIFSAARLAFLILVTLKLVKRKWLDKFLTNIRKCRRHCLAILFLSTGNVATLWTMATIWIYVHSTQEQLCELKKEAISLCGRSGKWSKLENFTLGDYINPLSVPSENQYTSVRLPFSYWTINNQSTAVQWSSQEDQKPISRWEEQRRWKKKTLLQPRPPAAALKFSRPHLNGLWHGPDFQHVLSALGLFHAAHSSSFKCLFSSETTLDMR